MFHISLCPLPSEVAHFPSVKAAQELAWCPLSFIVLLTGLILSSVPHSQRCSCLCAILLLLMIPLNFRPRGVRISWCWLQTQIPDTAAFGVRIEEINDFWGISYCFLFTLAFVCKPCDVLCISLTLPSQTFWELWKVLVSPQVTSS